MQPRSLPPLGRGAKGLASARRPVRSRPHTPIRCGDGRVDGTDRCRVAPRPGGPGHPCRRRSSARPRELR